MRTPAWLPLSVVKEARALLPTWVASVVTMAASAVWNPPLIGRLGTGVVAFGLGSLALGAQSFGHEYSHRTLGLLLSQPSDRRRLFMTKAVVLVTMLLVLATIAWMLVLQPESRRHHDFAAATVLAIVLLSATCLAPWLTMLARGPLGGTVFAISLPAVLWIAGELLGIARFGLHSREVDDFRLAVFWCGLLLLSAVAAISSWRMFSRLETIEGGNAGVRLPWRYPVAAEAGTHRLSPSHPLWVLLKKELRLQQMTFAIAIMYAASLVVALYFRTQEPEIPVEVLTVVYFALLSTLAGSLASAEERHLRTLEWQSVLPVAAWKQWVVKAGTAIGLALVMAIGIPLVVGYLDPFGGDLRIGPDTRSLTTQVTLYAIAVIIIASGSLYLSSLCTSGIRALVLFLPAAIVTLFVMQRVDSAVWRLWYGLITERLPAGPRGFRTPPLAEFRWLVEPLWLVLFLGYVSLVLTFAFRNHRSAEVSLRRTAVQAMWILLFLVVADVLGAGLATFTWVR